MLEQGESDFDGAKGGTELSARSRVEVRQILNHFENSLVGYRLPVQDFLS
jgi:hypothetical protein